MLKSGLLAFAFAVIAGASSAHDAPQAASDDAVVTIETPVQKEARANAEWARRILAGESSSEADEADGKACVRNPDRKPHGMVWGEVGTGGYRSGGAIVTQPVVDCGSLTVGYEQSHGSQGLYRRRR